MINVLYDNVSGNDGGIWQYFLYIVCMLPGNYNLLHAFSSVFHICPTADANLSIPPPDHGEIVVLG